MIGLQREAPKRQDPRGLWDNSPELRDRVKAELYEWGGAQRGGLPDLGYPHEQPFSVTPSKMPPSYDIERVQAITDTFTLWTLVCERMADADDRSNQRRLMGVLRVYFIGQGPSESCAKKMGCSRQHFYRLLGEAMYRFWRIHE